MQYWIQKGKYTSLLNKAWKDFVPFEGEAKTEIGELVRAFGRINYELFNNGCCNMFEELLNEDYEGSLDIEIDPMFQDFLNTILEATNNPDLIAALERECRIVYETGSFEKEKWIIDLVGDAVGEIVENYYQNS